VQAREEKETMSEQRLQQASSWTTRREEKERRMQAVMPWMSGPVLPTDKTVEALEALVAAGDRIVLEGDNQKQADFLSRSLVKVDAKKIHDLHLIISSISRPEHLTLFELGIAKKVDFAFAGPQSLRLAQLRSSPNCGCRTSSRHRRGADKSAHWVHARPICFAYLFPHIAR
jgi:malonate decarboxylase alpha subunit